jgi:hypothetical protein
LVGGVCVHGIPAAGSFVDMPTTEQFIYYLINMMYLCIASPCMFYVDFACKLRPTWKWFVGACARAQLATGQALENMRNSNLLVNWMHGSSHVPSGQLNNCGRHVEGAGRRIGENAEQLWSQIKVSHVSTGQTDFTVLPCWTCGACDGLDGPAILPELEEHVQLTSSQSPYPTIARIPATGQVCALPVPSTPT